MPFCQRCDLYEAYPNSCSCDASKGLDDVPISGDDSSSNENSARNGMAHTIPVSDENLMRSIHAVDFTNQVHPPCLTLSMRHCFYIIVQMYDLGLHSGRHRITFHGHLFTAILRLHHMLPCTVKPCFMAAQIKIGKARGGTPCWRARATTRWRCSRRMLTARKSHRSGPGCQHQSQKERLLSKSCQMA